MSELAGNGCQIIVPFDERKPLKEIEKSILKKYRKYTWSKFIKAIKDYKLVEEGDKISFANLKDILQNFLVYMFGDVKVRFRPSFFPFTEPSTEVDISCIFCKGCGCRVCKQTGWLEVLGSGIVDENVFKAVGYSGVSGYAFGLGVERLAMLLHRIPDLRSLFEGDLRLLEQFR